MPKSKTELVLEGVFVEVWIVPIDEKTRKLVKSKKYSVRSIFDTLTPLSEQQFGGVSQLEHH